MATIADQIRLQVSGQRPFPKEITIARARYIALLNEGGHDHNLWPYRLPVPPSDRTNGASFIVAVWPERD